MIPLTIQDLFEIPTNDLCRIYHSAQIACVRAAVNRDFTTAFSLIDLVVNARFVAMTRFENPDYGHIQFYNECIVQRDNLLHFLNTPGQHQFNFTSERLIANAEDAGIYVPDTFRPAPWHYYRGHIYAM